MAKIIPVLWCSWAAAAAPQPKSDLAALARSWREAPTAAHRAAIETFAANHSNDESGALAHLALGIGAYEAHDYPAAIADLKKAQDKIAPIADYAAYYLAAARVEAADFEAVAKDLAPVRAVELPSPLAGKAWIVEARALESSDAGGAIALLREHYKDLPQPDGDLTLAESYQAAGNPAGAVDFYQRVYYQYISGEAADRAGAALAALKDSMGADFPQPLPAQMLRRADRLLETRDYPKARQEYEALVDRLVAIARDQSRVRIGAAQGLGGEPSAASTYLRGLDLPPSEADAERLYYLTELARRMSNDEEMNSHVQQLGKRYPNSPWRLRALVTAANRYLLVNRPDDYVALYQAAYQDFPGDSMAGLYHWKVTFQAYLRGRDDATGLLREHLRNYPKHPTTGAALYFLGRRLEQTGDAGGARVCFETLARQFQNTYYGLQARQQMGRPELKAAAGSSSTQEFISNLKFGEPKPVPGQPSHATGLRIERARLLRQAGLNDLADSELRFGARTDGQAPLLAMEIADAAPAPHQGLRVMKSLSPEYLSLSLDQAPRKYWELLFPLPYRSDLMGAARAASIDPYLVAGLIRQESEFNPQAVSHAAAYGLTQVRPETGRQFARRAGITRFSTRVLFQPASNLRIGTSIFRSMLDQHGGQLEQTLASYNAGPNRVAEWLGWNHYREPAEFVEAIPYTETRDYVQAVLRNADLYRRLYQ